MADVAAPGFGPLTIANLTSYGNPLSIDFQDAITGVTIQRKIDGASTLTIQVTDPKRTFLNSPNFLQQGTWVEIPDGFGNYLAFSLVQVSKASDQLQLSFESVTVYKLRQIRGVISSATITDAGQFVHDICAFNGIPFVGPISNFYIQPTVYAMGTGTSYDPNEDAWTSFQRIASTLGWRCWESAGTVFFGPDEYWYNSLSVVAAIFEGIVPPVNAYYNHTLPTLGEFTQEIQLMDYDWDVGCAFGDMTITCMSHFWQYNPGEIVNVTGLGPANGGWIVSGMQRNFVNPQATITLTIPMPAALVVTPPVLPIVGGRVF